MLTQRGRQVVVVTDPSPSSPLGADTWHLSDGAVLHLDPSGPCVVATSAASVQPGSLVVLSGDRRTGWLLDHTNDGSPPRAQARPQPAALPLPKAVLRVRQLTCRPRGDLRAPPEVEARAGDPLLRGRR